MWLYRWLFDLLYVSTVERFDLRRRKSLAQAVPNLDRLLADPACTLAAGSIAIGPQRRRAAAVVTGLLMAGVFWVATGVAAAVVWKGFFPGAKPKGGAIFLTTVVVSVVLSRWYARQRFRGGQCLLTRDGVQLTAAGDTVFCPWALFNAAGQAILFPEKGSQDFTRCFILPVWPAAVPHVTARREGVFLFAQGIDVHTRQFRFRSANEAELRAWYEVGAGELATLLLRLARTLGTTPPRRAVTVQELRDTASRLAPAATLDEKGWLVASLTRLVFPPLCCDCGRPTETHQMLALRKPLLRLGRLLNFEGSESGWMPVPLCGACQEADRAQYRRSVLRRVKIALGGPLFLGLLIAPLVVFRKPGLWLAIELMLLLFLSLPGALVAYVLARMARKRRSAPVRVERYSPAQGTVAIRFRRPGYAEQVLAATAGSDAAGNGNPTHEPEDHERSKD
jgi:hypothetical protein